jgi:hypothetical protein
MPLGKISLLTSGHHVSLPRDHRKKLKDQIHKEEVTFEYTLKKSKILFFIFIFKNKQTIVTNKNIMQHVHQNNLLYDQLVDL